MPVLRWKLGGNANWINSNKWTFTSVSSHMWDGKKNKSRESKVMFECVAAPRRHRLQQCQSLPARAGQSHIPALEKVIASSTLMWKMEEQVSVRQHMLRGEVKGSESVRCWVLGLCAEDEEGQPRAHPVIPSAVCDCRASLQQGCTPVLQLLEKMLLFFFCANPPASKYHWILILESVFPSFF